MNTNPKQIVLEDDKILIPDKFGSENIIFYYSKINILKIVPYNTIFNPYGGAICIATEKKWLYKRSIY